MIPHSHYSSRIFRHRGHLFLAHETWVKYPGFEGCDTLALVPRHPKHYQVWLSARRQQFDAQLDMEGEPEDILTGYAWIYEIDLDNEVFLINSQPLFRLDHVPPRNVFLQSMGHDHYQHCAYLSTTPEEYRYNWHAPPPSVDSQLLHVYDKHSLDPSVTAIHELLHVPVALYRNTLLFRFNPYGTLLGTSNNNDLNSFFPTPFDTSAALKPRPTVFSPRTSNSKSAAHVGSCTSSTSITLTQRPRCPSCQHYNPI